MTHPTRRDLLIGAAATIGATSVGSQSRAAAHPFGKQAPGFYRYKVGLLECTAVNDGVVIFPMPDGFVRNVSRGEALAAAEAAYMPAGKVRIPFTAQLINTAGKLVLIDCGWGPGVGPTVGLLAANLAAAGVDPRSIDLLVMSHLHPDHTGGLRTAAWELAFSNAEIMVPAPDWEFWMSDVHMANASTDHMKDYFATVRALYAGLHDRVTVYRWDQDVASGVTALGAPGHTPGHTAFAVASGNQRVLIQSDVSVVPELFLPNPDWHVAFDVDPVQAVATRRKFYDMAAAEKALVIGYHFPFPAMGHVEKVGQGYRLVPIAWNPLP